MIAIICGHVLGRARLDRRRQAAERLGVLVKDRGHLVGQDADIDAALRGPRIDLVVDVGDVADIGHVVRAIAMPQQTEQHVEDDQHPPVADVEMIVDRRAAGIEPHVRADRSARNPLSGGSAYYRAATT